MTDPVKYFFLCLFTVIILFILWGTLSGCAHKQPIDTKLDLNFTLSSEKPPRLCLDQTDWMKMRAVLVRCQDQ